MDDRTFDSWIKSLSRATIARRGSIKGLLGAVFAVALGETAPSDSVAKKKKHKHKHKKPRPHHCKPDCSLKECGDDGCGKSCGNCPDGYDCVEGDNSGSTCEPAECTPDCSGQTCDDDGCGGTCACADPSVCDNGNDQCCDPEGVPCTHFSTCCSKACDFLVDGGTCASCRGWYCGANYRCCDGLNCINNRCDGCLQRAIVCTSDDQCCFSTCTNGVCLSGEGDRCVHDADCEACYLDDNCTNACVNGSCAF